MVTFAQLRHSSFEPLGKAGDTWNGVSGHVEQIAGRLRSGVLQPLTGVGPHAFSAPGSRAWTGLAADEAAREIGLLADELTAFRYEALAVTAALRRAESAFARARQDLLRAVGDAEGLGATVSDDGTVTLPPLPAEERNDPDSIAYQKRKWDEVQQHIEAMRKAVTTATEADTTAAAALRALDPTQVDPATRPGAVQDARDDLARAAGMPSDPKARTAWWAALDPAVRAGLLSSERAALVNAGLLGPTVYEWEQPDDGAGPFAARNPSMAELTSWWQTEGMVGLGSLEGKTDAGRHMQHFLEGSGKPLAVDVDRLLRDDPTFRDDVAEAVSSSGEQWRQTALDAYQKSGGAPVAVPIETPGLHRTIDRPSTENWYLAIGSHAYSASGVATARPGPDGRPVVTVEYQVNLWDRYNWDPGKSTPIAGTSVSDSDLATLHQTGLAQEFDITGNSTPTTVVLDGNTATPPPGTGKVAGDDREGGPGDMGRETR
ncbi:hypothetical protein ACFVYP_07640 [Kitasatospora sp. NPDC058201]|uniref:hypothetical protein n=1 Tax=unclassified Kitasatospora TaxID=2633591 RepID=UPI003649993A